MAPIFSQASSAKERGHLASFRCIPIHFSLDPPTALSCGHRSWAASVSPERLHKEGYVEAELAAFLRAHVLLKVEAIHQLGRAASHWRSRAFTWQVKCSQL